jgi:hypothetical protein
MHRTWRLAAPVLTGIALVAIAAVTPAGANEFVAKQWEIGGDLVHTRYDNDSTIADTFSFAVRAGYAIRPKHMIELNLNFQSADQDIKGSTEKFNIERYTVNYVGNIKTKKPDSKFIGYAQFGLGKMFIDGNGGKDSTTLFRAGGGTRYFFTKKIALRVEGDLAHFHGDGEAIPRRSYFDFDFGVGVSFLVGGA